ncbi:MAG: hypothetical protein ABIJ92_02255 [Candidatus Aenigmatarchaeota archaeon]
MYELKRVGVVSVGKIFAFIGLILGIINAVLIGIILVAAGEALGSLSALSLLTGGSDPISLFLAMGMGAVIVVPILYAISGFIGGVIVAFFYNLAAGKIGGIEMDLQNAGSNVQRVQREEKYQQPPPPDRYPQDKYPRRYY